MSSPADTSFLEIFERPHASHLDAATLDDVLAELLALFPEAPVSSLRDDVIGVPMPASIPLVRNPIRESRSGIDLIVYDSAAYVAWKRMLELGVARCPFELAQDRTITGTSYLLDLRENHGVVLSLQVFSAADAVGRPEMPLEAPEVTYTPRFTTIIKDIGGVVTALDGAFTQLLGYPAQDMIGKRSIDFLHPEDHPLAVDHWMQMLAAPGPARRVRVRHRHADGSWLWFEITNHNLLADRADPRVVAEMVDISEEMSTLEELRARERLLDRLAEAIPVGLLQIDTDRRVVYTNERLHEIVGCPPQETIDDQFATIEPDDRAALEEALHEVLDGGRHADFELRICPSADHEARTCTVSLRALSAEDGSTSGAIICVTDVTASSRMREELRQRATFDELTGAHNRASIMAALEANIASGKRRADRAVVYVDVDHFKGVNDEFGHSVGDEVLRTVVRRLQGAIRDGDMVGRIGGDEFLVLCPEIGGTAQAMRLAQRIAGSVRGSKVVTDGGDIAARVSVGVAWSGGSNLDPDMLVALADHAMYESKREQAGVPKLAAVAA